MSFEIGVLSVSQDRFVPIGYLETIVLLGWRSMTLVFKLGAVVDNQRDSDVLFLGLVL